MKKRDASDYASLTRVKLLGVLVHTWVRYSILLTRHLYESPSNIKKLKPKEMMLAGDNVQLHVLHWPGRGTPIVALHGLSGVAWTWSRIAALVSPAHDFYAISMRGHGLSDAPESGYSLKHTSEDIKAILDAVGLDRVHLAGESWGGKAALHFAATYPKRIRSLLLADPVLPYGLNPFLTAMPSVLHAGLIRERLHFATREQFEKTGKHSAYLPLWDELDRIAWEQRFVQDENGCFVPRLPDTGYSEIIEQALQADIRNLVDGLDVPTLYMQPSGSIAFWPGEANDLKRRLSDLQSKRLRGDHTFVASNPHAAANIINQFLDERFDGN